VFRIDLSGFEYKWDIPEFGLFRRREKEGEKKERRKECEF
jgi:hypothetical protein